MSKKGETGEQDRGKPQPQKKKDRETKRKDKKSARLERQKSRQVSYMHQKTYSSLKPIQIQKGVSLGFGD